MPQDIPAACNGCLRRLPIEYALSCPRNGLVLEPNNNSEKEWGTLGARAFIPSTISYKPKISSRKVQVERTGDGARQDGGTAKGGAVIIGESQGGRGVVDGQ